MTLTVEIDPFAVVSDGCYSDGVVTVVRRGSLNEFRRQLWTLTETFAVGRVSGRLALGHALPDPAVNDDLTGLLYRELIEPGRIDGADCFERIFTGIVLTSRPDPMDAWELFYRNSLRGTGAFDSIYRHAEGLTEGSVLDLGSCFGFFPLRLRAAGRTVTASDVRPGTRDLIDRAAGRLGLGMPVLCCDAAAVPLPDRSVDTVTLLHLLEHVDEAHGRRIVEEARRLARRRVVIAVPLETEAEAGFGHVRTLSRNGLAELGHQLRPGRFDVHEHEGGWLVLDL